MANFVNIDPKTLAEGDIFELMGLQNLSEEKKAALMSQLAQGVQSRVLVRLDDLLKEEDRPAFKELVDKATDEEILRFLEERDINVGQLVVEESLLEKAKVIELAQKLKEPKE